MAKKTVIRDADIDRIHALLKDYPDGLRAVDIPSALAMGRQRVWDHLAAGRRAGLFILCRAGGMTWWYSSVHAGIVKEKRAAALVTDLARRRERSRAWHMARVVKAIAEDIELLPVKRRVVSEWEQALVAPGPVSVFTLMGGSLSNC